MLDEELKKYLEDIGCEIIPCGSRVTCNPPPINTDYDYLVAIDNDRDIISDIANLLGFNGFKLEGSEHYQAMCQTNNFMSWRKNDINLIVSGKQKFIDDHKIATSLCKKLNLMNKQDRIDVFHAILYRKIF